ncbi:MAG: transposase [Methylococcales bacterium]|nr:transposase [Methylococcales bacterium]
MEACAGTHYRARALIKLGHDARLISPQFVKPYVKGNKNDANDAEAICEAAACPTVRFVAVKSIEQQDIQMLHRVRSGWVKERTAGLVQSRQRLPEILEDAENNLTMAARQIFADLYEQLVELNKQVSA